MPGAGLSGIRFTFALIPDRSFTRRRASSGESFTPSSITYSNVMRLRFLSGNRRQASRMAASGYLRFGGTSAVRCSSVVAWSETARFGISGSHASRSRPGTIPTVESVTRRGEIARPCSACSIRSAFIVLS